MKKTIWPPTLAWLAAVVGALVLAFAGPNESSVMGRLHPVTAKRLDQQVITLPQGFTADRTLALVAFQRGQRAEIESWIDGLRLRQEQGISWLRMPVLDDPGTETARNDIHNSLLARHSTSGDKARLVPIFTNREAFIRAAGLSGTDHASVLVVNREGKVLARAEGLFDHDKAQALRETLLAQGN